MQSLAIASPVWVLTIGTVTATLLWWCIRRGLDECLISLFPSPPLPSHVQGLILAPDWLAG